MRLCVCLHLYLQNKPVCFFVMLVYTRDIQKFMNMLGGFGLATQGTLTCINLSRHEEKFCRSKLSVDTHIPEDVTTSLKPVPAVFNVHFRSFYYFFPDWKAQISPTLKSGGTPMAEKRVLTATHSSHSCEYFSRRMVGHQKIYRSKDF
jgi:hypothetical protein